MDSPKSCRHCGHSVSDHYEDGMDAPPTACAYVYGPNNCLCGGFIGDEDGDY